MHENTSTLFSGQALVVVVVFVTDLQSIHMNLKKLKMIFHILIASLILK